MRLIDADHLRRWILSRVFKTQLSVADIIDQIDREDTIEPDPDTVSRQAAINTVNNMRIACDTEDIDDYRELMLEAVKALPPSSSRPHGQWIDINGNVATCSVCGERWGLYRMLNFCPHCGADMRGGAV